MSDEVWCTFAFKDSETCDRWLERVKSVDGLKLGEDMPVALIRASADNVAEWVQEHIAYERGQLL